MNSDAIIAANLSISWNVHGQRKFTSFVDFFFNHIWWISIDILYFRVVKKVLSTWVELPHCPVCWITGGHQKVLTISQDLSSIQHICFRKTLGLTWGRQIVSCPGCHLTSVLLCSSEIKMIYTNHCTNFMHIPYCSTYVYRFTLNAFE